MKLITFLLIFYKDSVLLIFNPGVSKTEVIRLKVPRVRVRILDEKNREIPSDVICDRNDLEDCEAYFITELKEFNFQQFLISHDAEGEIIDRKLLAVGTSIPLDQESFIKVEQGIKIIKKKLKILNCIIFLDFI